MSSGFRAPTSRGSSLGRAAVAAALSAFVWPGAGQLYNRDKKKGLAFIVLAGVGAIGLLAAIGSMVSSALEAEPVTDPAEATALATRLLAQSGGGRLSVFSMLITVVWAASVVDAFMSARRDGSPRS